jgi:ribosomal protein L37E
MANIRDLLEQVQLKERELTKKELKRREEIADKLPDAEFKKRYGDDWKSVKIATATNIAKSQSEQINEETLKCPRCGTMNETPFDKCSNCGLPRDEFASYKKEEVDIQEDGHTDVASALRKCVTIMEDASQIKMKLKTMSPEGSLPSWWTNKLAVAANSLNKMRDYFLIPVTEQEMACPIATKNIEVNVKNRDATIKNFNYGPLNVDEPGDYWKDIAKYWNTTEEAAKKSLCNNCVAFDVSPRMLECMPGETSDDDGRLGYCWMHHFKCHSARACHTWAKGGPITEDEKSYDWQKRANIQTEKKREIDPADIDLVATDDDRKAADKNILVQLKRAQDMRGKAKIEFADKKKVQIPANVVDFAIKRIMSMKPSDRLAFTKKLSRSYKDLLKTLKEK